MKNTLDEVAGAIRRHGLHKLASRMIEADGLPAPKDWTYAEVGMTLGAKLATDRLAHRSIVAGLGSLHEVSGSYGTPTEKVSLYEEFSRVNSRVELAKVASAGDEITSYEIAFWQRCKRAAANDHEGSLVGLAKVALSILAAAGASGEKVASTMDEAYQFAASFACASVVDDAIVNMIKSAEITPSEGLKLAALNAEAAVHDLRVLTKNAAPAAAGRGMFSDAADRVARRAARGDGPGMPSPKPSGDLMSKLYRTGFAPRDAVADRAKALSGRPAPDRLSMLKQRQLSPSQL